MATAFKNVLLPNPDATYGKGNDTVCLITLGLVILFAAMLRVRAILPNRLKTSRTTRKSADRCTVAVFLGSGGHTSEALTLISALDWDRYNRRIYIVNESDSLSLQKAYELERKCGKNGGEYSVVTIPRARHVHQGLLSTMGSSLYSLVVCLYYFTLRPLSQLQNQAFADVLILNGPGTCFILCVAIYVNKFLGLKAPIMIYVESFARVKSLSLSGKLIRPFVDRFVTQWPQKQSPPSLKSEQWLV